MELPEYRKIVKDSLEELLITGTPYCENNSPLSQEISQDLRERLERAKTVCEGQMERFRPRIMLYGVYNSGKSTLLNAFLGEARAAINDIPETAQSTSYDWHGHEIIDTPGIDAPIEHETISRETLRSSQIILFVVSAKGTFENNKIYEAMRDVVDQGKKLIIVLNNKDDEHTHEDLANIKERIQKILEANGFTRQQAASFRLELVNALYAMQGRMDNDENLIEYSGIKNLEEVIHNELFKTDGYAIVKDSLNYLLSDYRYFLNKLHEYVACNNERQIGDFYKLRDQYYDFLASLENNVDMECSSLAGEVRHCFPAPGSDFSSHEIQNRVNSLLEDCLQSINGKVRLESEKFMNIMARQGMKILQSGESGLQLEKELGDYEALMLALKNHQEAAVADGRSANGSNEEFLDKLGDTAATLSALPLMKLPLPLPIPPIVITAILIGIKIIASIFGKSDAEKQNDRMEAQIAYEREMAEKQARAQERQREEIKSYADDIKTKFVRTVKNSLRESIESKFKPVLNALEAQCAATSQLSQKIRSDISRLQDKISEIESISRIMVKIS